MLFVSVVFLIGCTSGDEPVLDVKNVRHKAMPADGLKIPAPRGMTVGPNDTLYVLDNGGRVLVYSAEGDMQASWHMPEYDVGRPEGICVFEDGRIAVADTHYHRVVFFAKNGDVKSMMGKEGEAEGEFIWPVAIVQDDDQDFYVSEYGGENRIQKFSVEGKFLKQWGGHGTEPGLFQRPSGMVWHDGKIYAADAFNNRIQVFTDEGEFIGLLGAEQGENAASLHYPYDITRSVDGDFFVVEYGANRVTRLSPEGRLLGRFGSTGGDSGQFLTPWGLTIDTKHRVWVADTGNRRIVELEL
ncbi:MAG: hypothetical protein CMJ78_18530 [Planctomycetaceae bacterium]|nr:hypothetical protein [Planctomycetaceae bacterium]